MFFQDPMSSAELDVAKDSIEVPFTDESSLVLISKDCKPQIPINTTTTITIIFNFFLDIFIFIIKNICQINNLQELSKQLLNLHRLMFF